MVKNVKRILIGVGIVVAALIGFAVYFLTGTLPYKDEEDLVKKQATQYLKTNPDFKGGDYEIYGTVYDNMGNFGIDGYAAKVRNKDTGEEFLVYYNKTIDKMQDTKTEEANEKMVEEIKPKIMSYIKEKFGKITTSDVGYSTDTDKTIISFSLPRKKEQGDEERFNEFITFIQNQVGLQHAEVIMGFDEKDNGLSIDF